MSKNILFGAAYYLEYMPYERMEKDFDLMKQAGINVIRIAESTWSTLEPKDGIFDFSYIDPVLDMAKKKDIKVIIGTPTYAIPAWLAKKDENVLVMTKHGRASYGPRQLINLWSPTFRYHAERVIRKLIGHTAGHENVIGFQIDNETKHYGNYGQEAHALFKEYLKDTYKTTDNFNHLFGLAYWSNAVHDWDDLPNLSVCINGSLAGEYEKFLRTLTAQYLQWQADIVSEYKREDQFITHNFDFEWTTPTNDPNQELYSYGVQSDICHYEASKALTLAGTDIYHPTQDRLTGAEIAFGGDSIRCLKYANYLVVESQSQGFKGWTPYPGQLRLHAYSHLASGALGQMYWNWHSIHNAFETYWRGILCHDLSEDNPVYREISSIGDDYQKFGAEKLCLTKKNRVAVIADTHSLIALRHFPIDKSLKYNDVMHWMYDSLYEMNIECDVVDVNALDTSRYNMIVTPALYSASEDVIKKLDAFVYNGGVLVSSFKSFFSNERYTVYPDAQPHLLHKCFGMSYNQFSAPGKTTLLGHSVTGFMELLKPNTAQTLASYDHKYWGQYAAITHNAYGMGHAYYIGCYTDKSILKDVYKKALADANIKNPTGELEWPVIIRSGVNAEGHKLHYLLHYSEDDREVKCPYEKVTDLLTGKSYSKDDIISLTDWDVKVLEEM